MADDAEAIASAVLSRRFTAKIFDAALLRGQERAGALIVSALYPTGGQRYLARSLVYCGMKFFAAPAD
jgi:hypothetical protein